jgi:hypothetical protein
VDVCGFKAEVNFGIVQRNKNVNSSTSSGMGMNNSFHVIAVDPLQLHHPKVSLSTSAIMSVIGNSSPDGVLGW